VSPGAPPIPDLALYDFELPAECIAQTASERRDAARLMCVERVSGAVLPGKRRVSDLPGLLRAGDLLVVNATRVLPARLRGRKATGGAAEALILGPAPTPGTDAGAADANDYRAWVRISGRLREGLQFEFGPPARRLPCLLVALAPNGEAVLRFAPGESPYAVGEAPLPPYIRRRGGPSEGDLRERDLERYQTVYAREPGAVAAPTAGLHLTRALLDELKSGGVECAEVVLHVGPGTFRPLRPEDLAAGRLHSERYELPAACADAIARTRSAGGRVIAVGTTTTRVLESCARADGEGVEASRGETDLFLRPGTPLQVVDGLLTNFHLPGSSLLLLVAAMIGREQVLAAYRHAIDDGYRFYSYGDAMLIL